MNLVPSQVDDDATDIQDVSEAMRDIIAQETQEHTDAIETMQRTLGEEQEPSPQDSQPDGEGTSPQGESAQNSDEGKKPGIDVLLQDVENQLGHEHAEVIRGLQRGYNQTREDYRDAQAEMRERIAELEGAFTERQRHEPEEPEAAPDPNDPINKMTPDQRELFQRLFDQQAEAQGMVRRDQLEAEKVEADSKAFVDADVNKGIEVWGEKFGARDADGKFLFAEDAQQRTSEVFDRIYDPQRGLSATDLYVLANWETLLDTARGQEAETQQTEQGRIDKNRASRQAITENRPRSTGKTRDNGIYRKGEPFTDTIARAVAASYRELPELTK